MASSTKPVVLKHKVYTDSYTELLRQQALSRTLDGLNLEALDSCGAGLGTTDEEIEATRREWEERTRTTELENVERTVKRQREGLHILLERGGTIEGSTVEPCNTAETQRLTEGGFVLPDGKYVVYLVRVS